MAPTEVGSSPTAVAPLWVFLRGGGVGYFDSAGNPMPTTANKSEEAATSLRTRLVNSDMMQLVRNDRPGFGMMSVSNRHVPTSAIGLVNTDPAWPANYNQSVFDWVHTRLAD